MQNKFTEEDLNRFIDFLNFIAKKAIFQNWTTEDTVSHFKLISHMQQVIIPKIKDNILEIKEVIKPKNKSVKTESKKE